MRKNMSTKLLGLLAATFLITATTQATTASEVAGDTIKCPEGDTFKCYTFDNGGVVYKGKGETVVIPAN